MAAIQVQEDQSLHMRWMLVALDDDPLGPKIEFDWIIDGDEAVVSYGDGSWEKAWTIKKEHVPILITALQTYLRSVSQRDECHDSVR